MKSCASTPTLESRVRKSGRRPLVGYAPWDRDNLKLIVRRPVPYEREALRSPLIFWRFARSCDFINGLGTPSGYELEEIRQQFHSFLGFQKKSERGHKAFDVDLQFPVALKVISEISCRTSVSLRSRNPNAPRTSTTTRTRTIPNSAA